MTREALDYALDAFDIREMGIAERLMSLYLLEAFAEVPDVLRRLKAAGLKTAVLSNGPPTPRRLPAEGSPTV